MPLYRNKDKVVLFIHIPKTGGSTVEEILKASGARQALKYHKRLGYSNSTPQHMSWEILKYWIPEDFYDLAFTVVREPLARMVSEYRWRTRISKKQLPPFDIWARANITDYHENPYRLDNHIRPQCEFIGPPVKIFRLEDGLEQPIRTSLELLGLKVDELSIHHKRKSELTTLEASRDTVNHIRDFYRADYEAFGYEITDKLPSGLIYSGFVHHLVRKVSGRSIT